MALRAGNSKQYNGYVVSWQMPAEVFAPISYRENILLRPRPVDP